ncbi:MAG: hypothetical protein CVU14_06820 [Bacteroidetes bacterium HGW-Bacteroidetes-9]|jgi:hypothetical protein|nr:MAG: hypothetical protein CVU14_06820 [Bacteroidetes bacterium HGW-Bacteroidetes-9]
MKPIIKTIIILTIFSIAMGFMESAIVVYLRELYYPGGFDFPLAPLDNHILLTELLREAATLIMLVTIGLIAGKNAIQKFAFFLFSFAVWDIFYYVFLKLLIGWPASLFTWDILFLLPVPWIGPVLVPCILSLTMMLFTAMVIYLQQKQHPVIIRWFDWAMIIAACLIILITFTYDYFSIILSSGTPANADGMLEQLKGYVPEYYNWFAFIIGEIILLYGFSFIFARNLKSKNIDY